MAHKQVPVSPAALQKDQLSMGNGDGGLILPPHLPLSSLTSSTESLPSETSSFSNDLSV